MNTNKPKRQTWAQFLPEIGAPITDEIARIVALEQEARRRRRDLMESINRLWTREERLAAKRQANASCLTKAF